MNDSSAHKTILRRRNTFIACAVLGIAVTAERSLRADAGENPAKQDAGADAAPSAAPEVCLCAVVGNHIR